MTQCLHIQDLVCGYGRQEVLKQVSLEINHGDIVCLLGASGCGKTTLLKALAGLLPAASGKITLQGETITDDQWQLPPDKRHIGMIFQDYALFPHLTVAKNIAFGLRHLSKSLQGNKVTEMLELVQLSALAERYPHQLSGGQQQRVAIARSLASQPDLLLLDEPFSNIDAQVRHQLVVEMRQLLKQQGVTAVFVTHSKEEAFAFADQLAVMNQGEIEQYGPASQLYHHPASRFVANFLGGGSYLAATRISEHEFSTELGKVTARAQTDIAISAPCEVLLRPQQIQLNVQHNSDIRVIEQQFMGDHCRYVIDMKGNKMLASASESLGIGQGVSVSLAGQLALAF
ncbi:ABC transporter ATP-binding protein [Vibrio profundum]|uniref:ABC transporter ATP-binding protein n=1 Tax=Vibrio profundum TaxID=2910247 RepID=UPI003D0C8CCF